MAGITTIAHPGKKVAYFRTEKDGKRIFERHELADIDADEAVLLHPEEWSFKGPKGDVVDKTPPDPLKDLKDDLGSMAPADPGIVNPAVVQKVQHDNEKV